MSYVMFGVLFEGLRYALKQRPRDVGNINDHRDKLSNICLQYTVASCRALYKLIKEFQVFYMIRILAN